jgi:hypothetical protein
MYRMKSVIWISVGVIIGWCISRLIAAERRQAETASLAEEEE